MAQQNLVLLGGAHVHLADHLTHAKARGWTVSHVFERDEARRIELCERLGAEAIQGSDLARTGCRAAIICSETAFHEADILAAMDAGLPVFVEKPLAGDAAAAWRCAARAETWGLTLHCGYFLRTNAALRALRDTLQAGDLGRVTSTHMRFSHDGGYADWLDLSGWMTDPHLACYGGFADEAVHVIDMLQWLLGPAHRAEAVTGAALGWPVDDHGAGLLTFEAGATGVIEAGWTDTEMRLELDLVGDQGWARLRAGKVEIGRRGAAAPDQEIALSPLDAGAGIEPFLNRLEGRPAPGLVPPRDAAQVNTVLDQMGLRLC